ncbi:MAG: hypothetical protein AABY22_28280 [Nanoarchaeota archaeon]
MKNSLYSILLTASLMGMPSAIPETPKDSDCLRGYYGINAVYYLDIQKKETRVERIYEFILLECLEYKLKEEKTNDR